MRWADNMIVTFVGMEGGETEEAQEVERLAQCHLTGWWQRLQNSGS